MNINISNIFSNLPIELNNQILNYVLDEENFLKDLARISSISKIFLTLVDSKKINLINNGKLLFKNLYKTKNLSCLIGFNNRAGGKIKILDIANFQQMTQITLQTLISTNLHLTSLNLQNCEIEECLNKDMFKNLSHLNYLNLSNIKIKNLDPISNLASLKELHLNYCDSLLTLKPLFKLSQLAVLNVLACPKIPPQQFKKLPCSLTSLNIGGRWLEKNMLNETSFTITHLSLEKCIGAITSNLPRSLTSLNLEKTSITSSSLQHIAKLNHLTFLNVNNCKFIRPDSLKIFKEKPSLILHENALSQQWSDESFTQFWNFDSSDSLSFDE